MGRVAKKKTAVQKPTTAKHAVQKSKENVKKRPSHQTQPDESVCAQEYEYVVAGSVCSKWKPLARTTLDFTQQLINNSSSLVMNRVHPDDYEAVEDVLDDLKKRVAETLATVKAPNPVHTDYMKLTQQSAALRKELDANLAQAERMEEEIQRLESNTDKLENELATKRRALDR